MKTKQNKKKQGQSNPLLLALPLRTLKQYVTYRSEPKISQASNNEENNVLDNKDLTQSTNEGL